MPRSASTLRVVFEGLLALAIAMGIGRFAYTPILPLMRDEGLLDIGSSGALASVHFAGYAAGAYLAGFRTMQGDRLLAVSLYGIAISTLAMGLTTSTGIWFAARGAAGLFSAFSLVSVSTRTIRHLSAAGRSELSGLVFSGVGCGIFCVGLLVLLLASADVTSQTLWNIFGAASLLAAVAISLARADTSPSSGSTNDTGTGTSRVPVAPWMILPYFAAGLGYIIPATYLPTMAQAMLPSPLAYGWGWPVFGAAAALSTILAARRRNRMSSRRIWILSQCVMAIGVMVPALWQSMAAIVVSAVCVGGTFMVVTMAGLTEAHRVAGAADAGRHVSAMTLAFACGQMAGPLLAGAIFDATGGFAWPLLLASGLLVLSLLPMAAQKPAQ